MKPLRNRFLRLVMAFCCSAGSLTVWTATVQKAVAKPQNSSESKNTRSVEGLWKAIDEKTKKPSSVIRLSLENHHLVGRVEKILTANVPANATCKKCKGERENKPIVGMAILWDLEADQEGFSGGHVLDPGSGSVYSCRVRLLSEDTLEVRGYIGFSAFGRSQIWRREPQT